MICLTYFDVSLNNLTIIEIVNNRRLSSKINNNLKVSRFSNLNELKTYLKDIIVDFAYGKIAFLNSEQKSVSIFEKMWDYFKTNFNKEDIFPSEYGEISEYFDYNHKTIDLLVDKFIALLNEK